MHITCASWLTSMYGFLDIFVPPEQVVDTVVLYYEPARHRKLSLRFLAWFLLKQDIQLAEHDSIEDARSALLLYKKYLDFIEEGRFKDVMEDIFDAGKRLVRGHLVIAQNKSLTNTFANKYEGLQTPSIIRRNECNKLATSFSTIDSGYRRGSPSKQFVISKQSIRTGPCNKSREQSKSKSDWSLTAEAWTFGHRMVKQQYESVPGDQAT